MSVILFICVLVLPNGINTAQDTCRSKSDVTCNEVEPTDIHTLHPLVKQDQTRTEQLLNALLDVDELTPPALVKDTFFRIVSMPLQTHCSVSTRIGGEWLSWCGFLDGDKFVCLDKLKKNIENGDCLIYSFGIADDWSFEDLMGSLGCTVRAFDPTIDSPRKRSDNVTFTKLGLGHYNGVTQVKMSQSNNKQVTVPVVTLLESMKKMGDEGKEISYLKVDVEGSEIEAVPEWITSGVLSHVRQIGIEFHLGPVHVPDSLVTKTYRQLIKSFQELHELGFKIISYNPNGCMGKNHDPQKRYYSYFDVVFYKHEK